MFLLLDKMASSKIYNYQYLQNRFSFAIKMNSVIDFSPGLCIPPFNFMNAWAHKQIFIDDWCVRDNTYLSE